MMGEMALASTNAEFGVRDFSAWMAAEQRRIFLLCRRMLQDEGEADSATQDAFLKAYDALTRDAVPDLEDPARWITRIAVNTCLDRLRSRKWQFWRKRPNPEDERAILDRAQETAPDAEDKAYAAQIQRRIAKALDRLSARQRTVFTLRHFEDLSLEQIADALDLDVGTVKAHMFRAIQKLREELRDLYGSVEELKR
jgi:RNA polymerase sigma-70 factor (ECF subfamily)